MGQGWNGRLIRNWIPVELMTSPVYSVLMWQPMHTFSSVILSAIVNAMDTFNMWCVVLRDLWVPYGCCCID